MGTAIAHDLTNTPAVLRPIEGSGKWQTTGAGPHVTFNFVQTANTAELNAYNALFTADGSAAMTTQLSQPFIDDFNLSITLIEEVANLDIAVNNDINADYLVGEDPTTGLGVTTSPTPNAAPQSFWAINLTNAGHLQTPEVGGGYERLLTTLHELGHAVGLQHPHGADSGSTSTGVGSFAQVAPYQIHHTVLSYTNPPNVPAPFTDGGNAEWGRPVNMMALDIASLHRMYGANMTTRTAASTYTLTDTVTTALDLTGDTISIGRAYYGIWDAGGADTITYSGMNNSLIQLMDANLGNADANETALLAELQTTQRYAALSAEAKTEITNTAANQAGYFSSTLDMNGTRLAGQGYAIANGAVIENGTGGSGADLIVGNEASNTLTGNAGTDALLGGAGSDDLNAGTGADEVLGGTGNDIYRYNMGDGADTFKDTGSSADRADTIVFGAGITQGSLTVTVQDSRKDILLNMAGADQIVLDDVLTGDANRIERFTFNDGSSVGFGLVLSATGLKDKHDLNGDGTGDILWLNSQTQQLGFFQMANGNPTWMSLGIAGGGYQIEGTDDFNGDLISDILWYNDQTRQVGIYQMGQNASFTWRDLGFAGTNYQVVGTGDLSGDGIDDILWYNTVTQQIGFYEMTGSTATWASLGLAGANYAVAGVGDFNGDGQDDILWFNTATNQLGTYDMSANNTFQFRDLGFAGANYSVVGVGDFNGDMTDDILWLNSQTQQVGYYQMGAAGFTWQSLGVAGTNYSVRGIGDFDGNGQDDIFWQNSVSNQIGFYDFEGAGFTWMDLGFAGGGYATGGMLPG